MITLPKYIIVSGLFIFSILNCKAQERVDSKLPYAEIPEFEAEYTAGTVAARMLDGLGFRFYWATEGLENDDLEYRAGENSRSIAETIDHIYTMTIMISNAVNQQSESPDENISAEEKRAFILSNISKISKKLKSSNCYHKAHVWKSI